MQFNVFFFFKVCVSDTFPQFTKVFENQAKMSHLSSTMYSFGAKIQIRLNKTVAKLLWKIDNFFGQLQICLVIGKIEWDICQAFAKNTRFVMILYYTSLSFQASRRHFENDLVFLLTSWNNKVSWFSETKLSDWHHYVQKAWLRGAQEGKCHVTLKRKIVLQRSVTPNDKVNTVFENYLIKVILYVAFDDFGVKIQRL